MTPSPWLQTLRLDMREFVASDFDDVYLLNQDPRVMRYIGDGRLSTRAETATAMRRIQRNYRRYPGLGNWRASRRDTGACIGWFTLKYVPKTVEVEVGYRLQHEAWGQGFATEGARELVRYGFDCLGLYRDRQWSPQLTPDRRGLDHHRHAELESRRAQPHRRFRYLPCVHHALCRQQPASVARARQGLRACRNSWPGIR